MKAKDMVEELLRDYGPDDDVLVLDKLGHAYDLYLTRPAKEWGRRDPAATVFVGIDAV